MPQLSMPDCLSLQFPLPGLSRLTMPRDDQECLSNIGSHSLFSREQHVDEPRSRGCQCHFLPAHVLITEKNLEISLENTKLFLKGILDDFQRHSGRGSGELDAGHVTGNELSRQVRAVKRARASLYRVSDQLQLLETRERF